jgi:uncharacterized alpha-E superfamily protein
MEFDSGKPDENPSRSLLEQVNAICGVFEQAWSTPSRVAIEQLLVMHPHLPRSLLRQEFLSRELVLVMKEGDHARLANTFFVFPMTKAY